MSPAERRQFDKCIYCDKPNGSGEHTVAASVGGLRTDNGIQCSDCNHGFSEIDESLASDLRLLNAQIGAQNGRTKKRIEASVQDPSTLRDYILTDGGELRQREAVILRDVTVNGVRTVEAVASNQKQADDFVSRMKESGKPTKTYRARAPHLLAAAPQGLAGFSGPPSFRAVAKTVLNLLAQWRPQAARDRCFEALKNFVRLGTDNIFAYFEYQDEHDPLLPPASFDFQHRFLISFDAETGLAYARVWLLEAYEITVLLGKGHWMRSETYVYDMDILAEHPPDDIKVYEIEGAICRPRKMTDDPRVPFQHGVNRLLQKVTDRKWIEEAPTIVQRLNATRAASAAERHALVVEVLASQRQRLLELATTFIERLGEHLGKAFADDQREITKQLSSLVSGDVTTPTGVTELTFVHAEMLRYVLADSIVCILDDRPIGHGELRDLLEGHAGLVAVGYYLAESVIKPALAAADD